MSSSTCAATLIVLLILHVFVCLTPFYDGLVCRLPALHSIVPTTCNRTSSTCLTIRGAAMRVFSWRLLRLPRSATQQSQFSPLRAGLARAISCGCSQLHAVHGSSSTSSTLRKPPIRQPYPWCSTGFFCCFSSTCCAFQSPLPFARPTSMKTPLPSAPRSDMAARTGIQSSSISSDGHVFSVNIDRQVTPPISPVPNSSMTSSSSSTTLAHQHSHDILSAARCPCPRPTWHRTRQDYALGQVAHLQCRSHLL